MAVTLPYLEDIGRRWSESGEDRGSPLWHQAHDLAGQIISVWPKRLGYEPEETPTHAARRLGVLSRLGDTDLIAALLVRIASGGIHSKDDNQAVLAALGLFPSDRRAALLERLIAGTADKSPGACADLLSRAVGRSLAADELVGPVTALIHALPGDPARAPKIEPWQEPARLHPDLVADLLTGLAPFDKGLAQRAVDHILAWPKVYDFDSMLVPALRKLMGAAAAKGSSAVERLRLACVAHLRARAAEPLQPPRDWRRPSAVGCTCEHCAELSRFLADPG